MSWCLFLNYNIRFKKALYLYFIYTLFILYLYFIYTLFILYLYFIYTYLYFIYT